MFILLIFSTLLVFSYNNCGGFGPQKSYIGTEIGNPGFGGIGGGNYDGGYQDLLNVPSSEVIISACLALVACNTSLTMGQCIDDILTSPGMDKTLGLPPGSYTNFGAMQIAEQAGTISTDPTELAACNQDLGNLTCGSSQIVQTFQPQGPGQNVAPDYTQVFDVSSGSCNQLY
jgi:hypothetical protein